MISTDLVKEYATEMETVLAERNWNYSENAIEDIARESIEAKEDLYNLFSKHPLWNPQKGMIQFDANINRPFSREAISAFLTFITSHLYEASFEEVPKRKWYDICNILYLINEQYLKNCSHDDIADSLNEIDERYRIRQEMRASKVIGRIMRTEGLDKIDGYDKRFSSMCDDINPIAIKRHTVLSLNPVDFLLMSNGDSWISCHNIKDADDPGCYSAGTISYMLDNSSFLFYTVDASYDGDEIEQEPKVCRQVFAYKENLLFQSRMYPQSCDCGAEEMYKDTREIVQKIISECENQDNLWITSKSDVTDYVSLGENAQCYPDWQPGCPGSKHVRISKRKGKETSHVKIRMGKQPICIECGNPHTDHETINCCTNAYYCARCGARMDYDDTIWINDDYYCSDCTSQCDCCGNYVLKDDMTRTYDEEYVCDGCLRQNYSFCEDVDDYVQDDDCQHVETGECFTYSSKGEYWDYCEDCGDPYKMEDLTEINGELYCKYCVSDHIEEE